jgi:hypothetical protein
VVGEIYDVFVSYSRADVRHAAEIDFCSAREWAEFVFPVDGSVQPGAGSQTFDHFAEGGLRGTLELPIGRQGIV